MKVELIAHTSNFSIPQWVKECGWDGGDPHASETARLIELAGRNCYQSWKNPSKSTTSSYIRRLIDHDHLSVIEHAHAVFLVSGVSRSFTHELVRHRHLSFSQLSQRYVDESDTQFVIPPGIEDMPHLVEIVEDTAKVCLEAYKKLCDGLKVLEGKDRDSIKRVRQAARCVLPNATETRIVVSGNFRAWREMILKRIKPDVDQEFQKFARNVLFHLNKICPEVFSDIASFYLRGDEG